MYDRVGFYRFHFIDSRRVEVVYKQLFFIKPIKCQSYPHIETSQLICTANQFTGFYMRATLALNGFKRDSNVNVFQLNL